MDGVRAKRFGDLKADLTAYIASSGFEPGMTLPSEQALMDRFGVSRHLLRRALDELQAERVIEKVNGIGSRIVETRPIYTELRTLDDPGQLVEPVGEQVEIRDQATPAIAALFGIPVDDPLFYIEQTGRHRVNGVKILLSRTLPAESLIGIRPRVDEWGERAAIIDALTKQHGPLVTTDRIRLIMEPPAEAARLLSLDKNQPVTEVRRLHRTRRGRLLMLESHTSPAGALEFQYNA